MENEVSSGQDLSGSTSQVDSQNVSSSQADQTISNGQSNAEKVAQAILELDKQREFSFRGQKYTPDALEKAMLRQKDYTQKTTQLAEERKALEQERKFYDNLNADLKFVRSNPSQQVIQAFIKTYPEKFHGALKEVLEELRGQPSQGQPQQQQQTQNHFDIDLMSRITKIESTFQEQEVRANTDHINGMVESLGKKYPDAIPELVIGRMFEAYNQTGQKPSDQQWEDTFKSVDAQIKQMVAAKYGEKQKQQQEANRKARDVDAGGGTPGRAPKKFGSLKEVTEFAVGDITGRNR